MTRSKTHRPESEHLRQEIRDLQSENRHLKRELAAARRGLNRLQDLEELACDEGLLEKIPEKSYSPRCEECKAPQQNIGGKLRIIHSSDCPRRKCK